MPRCDAWIYDGQSMPILLPIQDHHKEREAHEGDNVVRMLNDIFEVWNKVKDIDAGNLVEENMDGFTAQDM